ncbi:hypothetical protein KKC59_00620 [bacterium]|nr:hypothetical protein [bacterium]
MSVELLEQEEVKPKQFFLDKNIKIITRPKKNKGLFFVWVLLIAGVASIFFYFNKLYSEKLTENLEQTNNFYENQENILGEIIDGLADENKNLQNRIANIGDNVIDFKEQKAFLENEQVKYEKIISHLKSEQLEN